MTIENLLRAVRPAGRRVPVLRGRALLDEAEVGPKFARQARMASAGLPVPHFFCLPASLFTRTLAPVRPRLLAILRRLDHADPDRLAEQSDALRRLVLDVPVPLPVARAVHRAYDEVFGPHAVVSVRSSMVGPRGRASEDSAEDAFAGIGESFLYVTRDQVLERVRECWASGFGTRALLYRAARSTAATEDFAVSVGVQRMVFGRRSFVLFTCDPLTGARDRVLAAGLGIGEGVVQEKVPVDHHFIDRRTGAVRSVVAHKSERVEEDPTRPGSGPRLLPVHGRERDEPALTDGQIRRITELGDRVERLFGCPQDIEGTLTEDGAPHLLQARPVVLDLGGQRLWSNANITESYPGVTTALTYSFAQRFYREDFRDFYRRLGVSPAVLARHENDLRSMLGLLNGRVYYSLSAWYTLHRLSPTFPLWRASFERMMGMSPSVTDVRPDRLATSPGRLPETAAALLRLAWLRAVHVPAARSFDRWWQQTIARHRVAARTADPLQLARLMRSLWREAGERWGLTLVNDVLLQTAETAVMRLFSRWLPGADAGLHSDLLCGGEENRSVTILMSLVDLAERIRATPGLLDALADEDPGKPPEELLRRIEDGAFGTDIADRMRAHGAAHGDRGLQELKLEVPVPREQPSQLLRLAGEYARGGLTREHLRGREAATRRAAEERLRTLLAGHPVRRWVLRSLLAQQRRYINIREDTRYSRSELFGFGRQIYRRLGTELAARGALEAAEDVVHLTEEEILGHFDGGAVTDDLRGLARLRKAEHLSRAALGVELPADFATMGPVRDGLPTTERDARPGPRLRGLGSSGGVVRGTARVVIDPHQRVDPTDDLILVARETDPGWLFLMLSARGIVVERGTLLSHTAISGRKFGIPTVVALPGATRRIPDGARVEMDGATGTVTILDEVAE
ncbi:PEP/pyruvate-binding domain-containing protein [Streptomyces sp. NPDC021098]|uniref:PEP/pyruvate-binding domain-containing protein n=1 Tax=unclassified Streptomyces TaxID=2593676 RepID=UPI00378D3BA3